jgi:hypothetical protein
MSEFATKEIVAAQAWWRRKRWGIVEYAVILTFIAVLVIVALKFMQPAISNTLNNGGMSL